MSDETIPPDAPKTESEVGEAKVIHIAKAKKKQKLSPTDLAAAFCTVLDHQVFLWPRSPKQFEVITDPKGARTFIEIDVKTGVCRYVLRDAVTAEIVRYSLQDLNDFNKAGELSLTVDTADKIVKQWSCTRPCFDLAQVVPVRELSEDGLCWQRLPFDLAAGTHPTFTELFSAASNVKAVMQWVGSLFDADSPRQQYVYLWGHGGDGKGAFLDFLRRTFGPSYKSEIPPSSHGDRFWTHGLLGMRVVAFDDFTQMRFLTDGLFKGLTGGSTLRTEEKGGRTADAEFICKVIITSNIKPDIERIKSDVRRIIYSEFEARDVEYREGFKTNLWAEGAAFLWACREVYRELPAGSWIPTEGEAVETVIAEKEETHEMIFEKYFVLEADAKTSATDFFAVMTRLAKMTHGVEIKKFKAYMTQRHKIKRCQLERGGKWFYVGMRIPAEILNSIAGAENVGF